MAHKSDRPRVAQPSEEHTSLSFAVVGVYWSSHHRYFSYIRRYDRWLILLNLIFLLFIALMPFVAGLLGQNAYLPLGVFAYGLAVAATGFSIGALWWITPFSSVLVLRALENRAPKKLRPARFRKT